jgi:hypothetical protein
MDVLTALVNSSICTTQAQKEIDGKKSQSIQMGALGTAHRKGGGTHMNVRES